MALLDTEEMYEECIAIGDAFAFLGFRMPTEITMEQAAREFQSLLEAYPTRDAVVVPASLPEAQGRAQIEATLCSHRPLLCPF
mmetsp:Transcript_33404/g.93754  ORF Transcript_33404/g.93754 Transcript_33404/m.93754 type:complete len:83 (+) Transcript_33404:442-690(+)